MSIPYLDWALLTPYPPGDNTVPAPTLSWLHFDLTKGNTGSGWIAWNSTPPPGAGIDPMSQPAGAIPIAVTYDPNSSLVTITTPSLGSQMVGWANLSGVWIALPAGTNIPAASFAPPLSGIFVDGKGGDIISGDFSATTGIQELRTLGGKVIVTGTGITNQSWLAIPVQSPIFE